MSYILLLYTTLTGNPKDITIMFINCLEEIFFGTQA